MAKKKANGKNNDNTYISAEEKQLLLTPNQELFVFYMSEGDSQRLAYKKAYPNCQAADHIVDAKASHLFKKDKVRARYYTLMDEKNKERQRKAFHRAERATNKLEAIADGIEKFPVYVDKGRPLKDENGQIVKIEASVGQRISCWKEIRKEAVEIMKVQAEKEENGLIGGIDIVVEIDQ
ncbi:MAG: hypothetical protein J6K30_07595 [Oscillospiraceae bacterium]|nr:hypothetical protein [Oscillospiraceae bacterium]